MNHKSYLKGLGIGIIVTALVLIISGKINNKVSDEYVIKRAKELGMTESTTLTAPLGNDMGESQKVSDSDNKENGSDVSDTNNESATGNNTDTETVTASSDSGDDKDKISDNTDNGTDAQTDTSSDDKKEDGTETGKETADSDKNTDDKTSDDKTTDDTDKDDANKDSDNNDTKPVTDKPAGNVKTVLVEVKSGQSSETVSKSVMDAGLAKSETEFNKYLCENGYDKRLRVGSYNIPVDADFETISKYLCGMMNNKED